MQDNRSYVLETVKSTIKKHNLINKNDKILVGVSGGADSVCLLHTLYSIRKEFEFSIGAVHINHSIRGNEANSDAEYVKELCRGLNIKLFVKKVDVPAIAKEEGLSLETAGRLARYRAFKELCDDYGYNKTATAHNCNDQAETVLMRIIRGTGIDGLSGIKYYRGDGVIRPLLDVRRADIESYCKDTGLEFKMDSTNNDNSYTRNKIRNILLPLLIEEFNPNIISTLSNLSENSAMDSDFIKGYTKRLYQRINSPAPSKKPVVLDVKSLNMVDDSIKIRLIRLATVDAMHRGYALDKKHIESILNLLDKETGAKVELPEGLTVFVQYGWLCFEPYKEKELYTDIFDIDFNKKYNIAGYHISFEVTSANVCLKDNQIMLDYDLVSDLELKLRCRRNGDIIALYKDGKSKKLKDFFIDHKIPKDKRDSLPLICNEENVISVIGVRCAEPYKKTKKTKTGVIVTYDKENENR